LNQLVMIPEAQRSGTHIPSFAEAEP
jgi:hypothetical protein